MTDAELDRLKRNCITPADYQRLGAEVVRRALAIWRRERGLPASPPPPPEKLVRKVVQPTTTRSSPMTSDTLTATDVRKALARRDRLTAAEQQAVGDWIVRNCLDSPDQAAVRKVLAKVRAELPARVALSATLAAVRVRAAHQRARPVVNVGSTAMLARTARRPPTRCEPSR
jgi:hypothetical protein